MSHNCALVEPGFWQRSELPCALGLDAASESFLQLESVVMKTYLN